MKYTPSQIRTLVDLPEQTFRGWRNILPPLQGRNGYQPCFTAGDALALKIIKCLIQDFGIKISKLTCISTELFDACKGSNWHVLSTSFLLLFIENGGIKITPVKDLSSIEKPLVLLPLKTFIEELQDALMIEEPSTQQQIFQFSPMAITSQKST